MAIQPMRVFRLIPIAPPDDPNWGRAVNQGEIVVLARSSGEARAVAAMADCDKAQGTGKITTQVAASAMLDPKLYGVRDDDGSAYPRTGPPRVLSGGLQTSLIAKHDD